MSKEFIVIEGEDNQTVIRSSAVTAAHYWGLIMVIETAQSKYDWEFDSPEELEEVWKQVLDALGADELEGEFATRPDLH